MKKMNEDDKIIAFISPTPHFLEPLSCGEYNGYVAIPPTHIAYGVRYDDKLYNNINVHGGLTFSEYVVYDSKDEFSNIKKLRCGLLNKAEVIQASDWTVRLNVYEDEGRKLIPDGYFILGFDTCHYGDNNINWNKSNVIFETLCLKEQIIDLNNIKNK